MSEKAVSLPNPVKDILGYIIVILIIASVVGAVVWFLNWMKRQKETKATADEFAADQAAANKLASKTGVEKGRLEKLFSLARQVSAEMRSIWTSSGTVVSLLNQVATGDEMRALSSYYNNTVSDGKHNLKADVDSHVVGHSPWNAGKADIKFYDSIV